MGITNTIEWLHLGTIRLTIDIGIPLLGKSLNILAERLTILPHVNTPFAKWPFNGIGEFKGLGQPLKVCLYLTSPSILYSCKIVYKSSKTLGGFYTNSTEKDSLAILIIVPGHMMSYLNNISSSLITSMPFGFP